MTLALSVAVLGGLGAVGRYLADLGATAWLGRTMPWGTMFVNVLGSGLGGIVIGATTVHHLSPTTAVLLLTGFLGGFTTASTLAYEVVRLIDDGRRLEATGVALGTLVMAFAFGLAGYHLGTALT